MSCHGCGESGFVHKTGCPFLGGDVREAIEGGEIVLRLDPDEARMVARAFADHDLVHRRLMILADKLEAAQELAGGPS